MSENSPNKLFYGDNLDVLGRHVADESVDLVYLDPPFNSNANYNVLFAERDGTHGRAMRLFLAALVLVGLLLGWSLGAALAWLFPSILGPVPY